MRNKRFISLLLALALLLGMIPGVLAPALANPIEIGGDLSPVAVEQTPAQTDLGSLALEQTEPVTRERANDIDNRPWGFADEFYSGMEFPSQEYVDSLNGRNWMSGISGDYYLNDFNIPYTHDSAMTDWIYHWTSSAGSFFGQQSYCHTQAYYIRGQLNQGVRILDLRLNNRYEVKDGAGWDKKDDGCNLYLCHGKDSVGGTYWAANENGDYLTVHEVFYIIRDFLTDHPTETVVCNFEIELDNDDTKKYGHKIANRLVDILTEVLSETNPSTGKPYLYTEPGLSSWKDSYTHMPLLKDCRGQVELMMSSSQFDGIIGGMKSSIMGSNRNLGGSNKVKASTKIKNLKKHADWLKSKYPHIPLPGDHIDQLIVIDTNSHAENMGDFIPIGEDMHPLAIAKKVHPEVFGEDKPLSIPGRYYGWVKLDGARPEYTQYIWKSNFPKYEDYATVTVHPGYKDNPEDADHYAIYPGYTYKFPMYKDEKRYSQFTLPGDIYHVREYNTNLDEDPYFDHWEMSYPGDDPAIDIPEPYYPGDIVPVDRDMNFKAYYRQGGKEATITAEWLDCDNIDNLRPNSLKVICTLINEETGEEEERTVELSSRKNWTDKVRGKLVRVRPIDSRIPTGFGDGRGVDAKGYYRYEVHGDQDDLEKSDNVSIRLIHTVLENNAKTVKGSVSWEDHENADNMRPEEVTLRLLADGLIYGNTKLEVKEREIPSDIEGESYTSWSWEVSNCPVYKDGKAIEYSVKVDPVPGYSAQVNGTDVRLFHEAARIEKKVKVVWEDSDNGAQIRPSQIYVNLVAKDNEDKTVSQTMGEITDWDGESIFLYGKDCANCTYEIIAADIDGYITEVDKSTDGISDFTVTCTLQAIPKPSELNGVYKAGYKDQGGDVIGFGNGTYIKHNGAQDPIRMFGSRELIWSKYNNDEGRHHFFLGPQEVAIADSVSSRPWGIRVIGGRGTKSDPYTFIVLHKEAVSYWVASYSDTDRMVTYAKRLTMDYELITAQTSVLEAGKQYVLNETVTLDHRLNVQAGEPVDLILRNGSILNADYGIGVGKGATLNVYTEKRSDPSAGIYAHFEKVEYGTIVPGAAIGYNWDASEYKCGTIILHNGTIDAHFHNTFDNTSFYPAIGSNDEGGELIVYGGRVNARTSGNSDNNLDAWNAIGNGMSVSVYGGMLFAEAGSEGGDKVAIGGKITTGDGIAVYNGDFSSSSIQPSDGDLIPEGVNNYDRKRVMTIRQGHYHDFVYTVGGEYDNTIIATCADEGCTLDNKEVYLTLVEPTGMEVYNPNASADRAKATFSDDFQGFVAATHQSITGDSVKYYELQDGVASVLTEAPTDAGEYMAEVALPGVTTEIIKEEDGAAQYITGTVKAAVYYTIDKRQVKLTPFRANFTYGEPLSKYKPEDIATIVQATIVDEDGADVSVPGSFAWKSPDTVPPAVSWNEKYTVIFTPEDTNNYETATCQVSVNVDKTGQEDVNEPTKLSPTYTGEDLELVNPGSAVHGTMMYALGDAAPEKDSGWSINVPTGKDAGTYKVWYKVLGDPNYYDWKANSPLEVTISKAASSGEVTANALAYNEQPQALVTPVKEEGGKLQYFVGKAAPTDEADWADAIPEGTDAGTYTVFYRVKGDGNHEDSASASVVATIATAPVRVSRPPIASDINFGQALKDSALTGGAVDPNVKGHFEWVEDATMPTVADSAKTQYEVTFVPDNDNYLTETSYATVTVIPADPTVTPPTVISPLIYSGEAQALVKAGSAKNGTMKYAVGKTAPAKASDWSANVPTGTEVGDYTVWYKVFGSTNFNDTDAAQLLVTIYPAQSGKVTADSLVYTGEPQKLVVAGTVEGGTLQYYVGKNAPTKASSWKNEIPTGTKVGEYTVWYRVKGDANHNDSAPASVVAKIAKAPIAPALSITGWTYGDKANAPVLEGNPGEGTVTFQYSDAKNGTFTKTVPTQAGSWFVRAKVAATNNYEGVTTVPVSFAIAKLNVSIFADNKEGVYGDAIQELTYRISGNIVKGDDLGITLTTKAKATSAPGDYTITLKWNGNDNYKAVVKNGVYTVGKRPVSVVANAQTVKAGGKIAIGVDRAMAIGLADGHKLSAVTLTATDSAIKASGAKIVDAKNRDMTANYVITYVNGALNVKELDKPLVFPPEAKELTYNGKDQALVTPGKAGGGTLQYSTDNENWSAKVPTGTDAGKYTVYYRVKGDADHTDLNADSLKVTIAKAAPVVTAPEANELTYNGRAQTLVTPGNAEGGTLSYSLNNKKWSAKVPTGTKVGSYTVYYKVKGDKNHTSVAAKSVAVTIAERPVKSDYTTLAELTPVGSNKLKLSWSKVKDAKGYDVYFKNCDGKQNYERTNITSKLSYTATGLKKGVSYKANVVAWKKVNGKKVYIGSASPTVHAIAGGYTAKQCNAKSVTLSQSSLTLKEGKSESLKATVKGVKNDRKVLQHVRLVRYYSSDANVAKVSKSGKVTAVGKGKCTIWAIANNGVRASVKVKVN